VLSYELVVPGVDARTGLFTAVSAEGAVHGSGCAADSRPGQAPGRPTTRSIRSVLRGMPGPASLHKTLAFPPASAPAQYRLIANGTYSSDQAPWQPGPGGAGRRIVTTGSEGGLGAPLPALAPPLWRAAAGRGLPLLEC